MERIEGMGVPSLPISRLSFRAVGAGILVALVSQVVLLLLGGAIGLMAIEPDRQIAQGVGIGFLVWLLISLAVSAFLGAWVAASAAQTIERRDGLLHGLLTWAAVSLIGVFLVGGAVRSTLAGAFNFVAGTTRAAVQSPAAEDLTKGRSAEDIASQAGGALEGAGQALEDPRTAERVESGATGAAIGLWGLLAAFILPLLAALGGGALGSRSERKVLGYTAMREEPRRPTPPPTRPVEPTRPIEPTPA